MFAQCLVEGCTRDALFCGTYSIAQHLQNYHGLFNEVQEEDTEGDSEESRYKRANNYLIRFIATSFLPFSIVQNTFFEL